jgi:hypothetical protein
MTVARTIRGGDWDRLIIGRIQAAAPRAGEVVRSGCIRVSHSHIGGIAQPAKKRRFRPGSGN